MRNENSNTTKKRYNSKITQYHDKKYENETQKLIKEMLELEKKMDRKTQFLYD